MMHSLNGGTLHLLSLLLPLLCHKTKRRAAGTTWSVPLWADAQQPLCIYIRYHQTDFNNYCYAALRCCDEWNSEHFIHCSSSNNRFCQQPFVSWCISLPLSISPNQCRPLAFPRRRLASESIKLPATDSNCTQAASSLSLLRHKVRFRPRAPCNHKCISTHKTSAKKGFFEKVLKFNSTMF